jgi:hypothetical protein
MSPVRIVFLKLVVDGPEAPGYVLAREGFGSHARVTGTGSLKTDYGLNAANGPHKQSQPVRVFGPDSFGLQPRPVNGCFFATSGVIRLGRDALKFLDQI